MMNVELTLAGDASMEEGKNKKKGYAWAILAGFTAALAAISAKLFQLQVLVD